MELLLYQTTKTTETKQQITWASIDQSKSIPIYKRLTGSLQKFSVSGSSIVGQTEILLREMEETSLRCGGDITV